ncbi:MULTISPECIES: galactofuranose ABC transporter, permease protein YjfF [Micrococcaceae]|uniref:galactofuranose ABC transporter, permease protein YjfF n=1 Tax=Micrococcaceae TaxID=1268 RepID=UPI000CFD6A98|nr:MULTISPECIES: galactofuranose ABC transporter, permease protein YjfF [unclassified Arthrobacter]PQZ90467.1 sugar ABC transporter permease YjfF [Arthrobacter sp. MYb222]PRB75955.1 sugar ABC transporter permease YjfF [Arthrobacter sp. MYb214]TDU26159.1 monosaccharide ABC transporter membrane protein (CUT2 family) [Arthrobacter sp. JUb115]
MSILSVPRKSVSKLNVDRRYLPVLGTVVVFGLMLVIGGVRYENFLSPAVLSNLFINNAHLIVLAAGMTFVILTGGIDLSVGAVLALSSVITATMLNAGIPLSLVLPIAILSGSIIGLGMGVMIQYFEVQPFVATLAGMFLARGLCFIFAPESVPIRDEGFVALSSWGVSAGRWRLTAAVVIAVLVIAGSWWVLHRTRFGRTVYAVGGGEQSATLMGLRVARTKVVVYVISGTCAALGGILFAMFSRSGYALTGVGMELDAIAAVVIGGTLLVGGMGFILGSVVGVMVLGLIQTIITFEGTLSSWWTKIVIGGLLLIFVVLQRILTLRRN